MKRGIVGLGVILALAAPAFADVKPGDEKKKAPDAQGTGSDQPAGPDEPKKNPLPGIVEQMKGAQRSLAESDTGGFTQAEQERIVEALKLESSAVDALAKLIHEIESRPP